jgi:hypothetical protein
MEVDKKAYYTGHRLTLEVTNWTGSIFMKLFFSVANAAAK